MYKWIDVHGLLLKLDKISSINANITTNVVEETGFGDFAEKNVNSEGEIVNNLFNDRIEIICDQKEFIFTLDNENQFNQILDGLIEDVVIDFKWIG